MTDWQNTTEAEAIKLKGDAVHELQRIRNFEVPQFHAVSYGVRGMGNSGKREAVQFMDNPGNCHPFVDAFDRIARPKLLAMLTEYRAYLEAIAKGEPK